MRQRIRIFGTVVAAVLVGAAVPATAAQGAQGVPAGAQTVASSALLAGPCDASVPWYDINATLGSPFSFDDGATQVLHKQWRDSDVNYAYGYSNMAGSTVTMYRSDGARCGPVTLSGSGGSYSAYVGRMKNTGYGIWVCLNWPGGGKCTATKWE